MRMLSKKDLHNGMIIGSDIKLNNEIVIPRNAVLTDNMILQLSDILGNDIKVWVYDLFELKPLLFRDSQFARRYIDFLLSTFYSLFTTALSDREAFNNFSGILSRQLYTNRQLLYDTLMLRDNHCYTYEHSLNVTLYALIIGLNEGLSTEELQDLILGCLLHDLGKYNISNNILDKPDRLSDSEFKAIKQHPQYGVELAGSLKILSDRVGNIIIQHHEKLDGTGYPFGVGHNKIDHLAKIASVADIFDAVTSKRAYHAKAPAKVGIDILDSDCRAGKISKEEVNMLIKSLVVYPKNTLVTLNNGRCGLVLEDCNTRCPKILGYDDTIYDLKVDKGLEIIKVV